jgi:predicted aspartyl protease
MAWLLACATGLMITVLTSGTAQAANCSPYLRIINSIQMRTTADRTIMVVPVTIDSGSEKLLLDTGGRVSQISRTAAKSLDLPIRGSDVQLSDMAGNVSAARTTAKRLILGLKEQKGVRFGIAPNPDLGTKLPYDGLLATDLFVDADLDMDFGAGRLTAFSTDHCPGQVIYWPADDVAAVPVTVHDNLITIPIQVDGEPMTAVMDTGAQYTVMNLALARRLFGLTPDSPDMKSVTETSGERSITAYGHVFDQLTFRGVTVKNLRIYLMANQVAPHYGLRRMGGNDAVPDVIIGMDVLRHLHVYFATKEERLYISDAALGQSALFRYRHR